MAEASAGVQTIFELAINNFVIRLPLLTPNVQGQRRAATTPAKNDRAARRVPCTAGSGGTRASVGPTPANSTGGSDHRPLTTLRRNLAPTLPVEYTPQSEISRQLFVVMLGPRRDEQKIA